GMSTLGVNAIILGTPAIAAYHLFRQREHLSGKRQLLTKVLSFVAGAGALLLSATMFTILLVTNISPDMNVSVERTAIFVSLGGYAIQAVIEGVFSVMLISFLEQVKPELLKS
ncbi:MAG: energy-coupling factor ABC transporter permease, partial [Waterburya sp.]